MASIDSIFEYIKNNLLVQNLLKAFIFMCIFFMIVFSILRSCTHHNKAFSVPDFTGKTEEEVSETVKALHLRYIVFDSVYNTELPKGTVVEQHPAPGFKVKKNRKIFLTLNAFSPEMIAMPNLVDLTFRQAQSKLESYGLKLGEVSYEPDIGINVVLAQRINNIRINPDDSVIKGSYIDLVLGRGLSDERCSVPKLTDLTLDNAKFVAADAFLRIGAISYVPSSLSEIEKLKAKIYKQIPSYNKNNLIPLGSSIDVYLTVDSLKNRFEEEMDTTEISF